MDQEFKEESQLVPIDQVSGHMLEVEKSRAVQEVQASLVIAKRFPRNEVNAELRILKECDRFDLAKSATYSYPRGKEKVSGPTIRLAEVIARHWGNVDYGFRQLELSNGRSMFEAFCWDKETNTKAARTFYVEHKLQLKDRSTKDLTDPRDVYELGANQSQRRVRACILEIIPGYIVDNALARCRESLKRGEGKDPLSARITRMVEAFGTKQGVSLLMLEKRLGRPVGEMTQDEFVDFWEIYNSLDQGNSRKEQWFGEAPAEKGSAKVDALFDDSP